MRSSSEDPAMTDRQTALSLNPSTAPVVRAILHQAEHRPDIIEMLFEWQRLPTSHPRAAIGTEILRKLAQRIRPIPSLDRHDAVTAGRDCLFKSGQLPTLWAIFADMIKAEDLYKIYRNGEEAKELGLNHLMAGLIMAGDDNTCTNGILSALAIPATFAGSCLFQPIKVQFDSPSAAVAVPEHVYGICNRLGFHLQTILTPRGCLTDPHIDWTGLGGVVCALFGLKAFIGCPMTPHNRAKYAQMLLEDIDNHLFYMLEYMEDIHVTLLRPGDWIYHPPGFYHAVLSLGSPSAVMGYDIAKLDDRKIARELMIWEQELAGLLGSEGKSMRQEMVDVQKTAIETWRSLLVGHAMTSEEGNDVREMVDKVQRYWKKAPAGNSRKR
jgi:hypothetical protein